MSTLSTQSLLSSNSSLKDSRPNSGTSTPRSLYKERTALLPITTPVGPSESAEKLKEAARTARRRGWCRLLVIIVLAACLVVGLSVGLTIGVRKSSPPAAPQTTTPSNLFPVGSFAFTTALMESTTGCTSNPSTWRCYPYRTYSQSPNASLATFHWTISPRNSYTYQISSSENPFAPKFVNETMVLLEGNTYNERLVFNFSLPKTVVPSEAISAGNRATTCMFSDTVFRATVWTRRNVTPPLGSTDGGTTGNATVAPPSGGGKWAAWPGQVEIVQMKTGGPECEDYDGNAVPVAAGQGQCKCRYANFDLGGVKGRRRSSALRA
ncbi:hypothetical protein CCHL11_06907 [Colletotrichum chlorophyti]|uniref:Tat pathway signal sequence n=1 Tax=Colletotrichum chlorophyti TaxID=708187 RepID=A0A1Q8RBQ5_9PEZI|nr:hypothetical protein CCHL11_06907 [Colletotrichum chlorophyti]